MKVKEWQEDREARKRKWVARLNYWGGKAHSLVWVLASIFVLYQSNFFYVAWNNASTNMFFLGATLVLFGIFSTIVIYGSFFLPADEEVEVTAPSLLPLASAVGGLLFLCSLIAFWPIWGWVTPLILAVLHIGFVMAGSALPKNKWGSAATIGVFLTAVMSTYFIPHQGLLH